MKKQFKIIAFLVIIIAGVAYFFWQQSQPLIVELTIVEKADMVSSFTEKGKLEAEEIKLITPAYAEKILYIHPAGQKVKQGDLLLQLANTDLMSAKNQLLAENQAITGQEQMSEPKLYNSQLQSYDTAIALARDALNRAREDRDKFYNLYQQGAIAEAEYKRYQRVAEDAEKALALKQSERQALVDQSSKSAGTEQYYGGQRSAVNEKIKALDNKLQSENIYAENDAIVLKSLAKEGSFANPAVAVLEIASLENLLVTTDILAADAMALSIGQQVLISVNKGEEKVEFAGKIVEIADNAFSKISALGLEEQRVKVKISADNLATLILGAEVDVEFETMHLTDQLVVPKTAVFKEEEKYYLWQVENESLSLKEVEIGKDSDYDYQVVGGLELGAQIVIDANNKDLKVGQKVSSGQ